VLSADSNIPGYYSLGVLHGHGNRRRRAERACSRGGKPRGGLGVGMAECVHLRCMSRVLFALIMSLVNERFGSRSTDMPGGVILLHNDQDSRLDSVMECLC